MMSSMLNAESRTLAQLNTWIWLKLMTLSNQIEKGKEINDKSGTFQLIKKITSNRNSFKLVKHKLANKTLKLVLIHWDFFFLPCIVCVCVCATNLLQVWILEKDIELYTLISDGHVPRMWISSCKRNIKIFFMNILSVSDWNWNSEFMFGKYKSDFYGEDNKGKDQCLK